MPLPVLYMPDGGIAEDFLHIAGLLQISVLNGTMRPFLLVGIENTERRRDLTGPTRIAKDSSIAPRVGGSASFRRFIRTELIPAIEARYRTTAEAAIIGESLAGLFIVETFLQEPDRGGRPCNRSLSPPRYECRPGGRSAWPHMCSAASTTLDGWNVHVNPASATTPVTAAPIRPLTTRTRVALAIARAVAAARGDRNLTPTHVAVGIFREGANPALSAIYMNGVDPSVFRRALADLETALGEASGRPAPRQVALDFTPGEESMLLLAETEATTLGDPFLGTEHILLAMLRASAGVPASILASYGITAEVVTKGLLAARSGNAPD